MVAAMGRRGERLPVNASVVGRIFIPLSPHFCVKLRLRPLDGAHPGDGLRTRSSYGLGMRRLGMNGGEQILLEVRKIV